MAEKARVALVVWKDDWTLAVIPVDQLADHRAEGRVFVVAVEDDDFPMTCTALHVQSNPNRSGDDGA